MPGAQHLLSGGDRERIGVNVCAFEQLKGGGSASWHVYFSVYIIADDMHKRQWGQKSTCKGCCFVIGNTIMLAACVQHPLI